MNKEQFLFVEYNNVKYPKGYNSDINEIAAHFDTYFDGNEENKRTFLEGMSTICSDEQKRFLVPEVNSGAEDLKSILADMNI